jgi:serine/threonine protein phosphatase 1
MNTFIVGDIHGCYYTLEKLLKHWQSRDQQLIFVGDYIDRGNFSGRVLKLLWEIQRSYPNVVFLKGNHEYIYVYHNAFHSNNKINSDLEYKWPKYCSHCFGELKNLVKENITTDSLVDFISTLDLSFDSNEFSVSHAGISITDTNVYDESNYEFGILWTRKELKNIGKPQIVGHTPHDLQVPLFNQNSNTYNIDSGCCYGRGLTGIVINNVGELQETYFVKVDSRDLES